MGRMRKSTKSFSFGSFCSFCYFANFTVSFCQQNGQNEKIDNNIFHSASLLTLPFHSAHSVSLLTLPFHSARSTSLLTLPFHSARSASLLTLPFHSAHSASLLTLPASCSWENKQGAIIFIKIGQAVLQIWLFFTLMEVVILFR